MERVKQFDLRVESASPEIRNLLVDALASSGLGVLSHVKSEELYPGAFDSTFVSSVAIGVASQLITNVIEKVLYPVLSKYARRVFIDGHEITQLNLRNLESVVLGHREPMRDGQENSR
jgi:hypothetical protein